MAEAQDGQAQDAQEAREEESREQDGPDYRALYEQAKANSRKWERQAKANREAAEAGKDAEERIAELTRRLDEKERAEERSRAAAKVAAEKGVPADLIAGESEEEMAAHADRMLAHFSKPAAPPLDSAGSFARGEGGDDPLRGFARQLLGSR